MSCKTQKINRTLSEIQAVVKQRTQSDKDTKAKQREDTISHLFQSYSSFKDGWDSININSTKKHNKHIKHSGKPLTNVNELEVDVEEDCIKMDQEDKEFR